MEKRKHIRAMLLLIATWLISTNAFAYDAEINGIYYNFSGDEAEVTYEDYYSQNSYTGDVVIPESVVYNAKTYSVTSIGKSAFEDCFGLTSVTIPNSVTSIGDWAFNECSGLTSINIPNSVTSIGDWAFDGCSGLTSINIPNSVTSIGSSAFYGCSGLTSVNIPNSVTSIGDSAFKVCKGLTSVTIPNSVTSIGSRAFYNCSGLTSVTIPNSVTSIGEDAFYRCSGLTSVTIGKSVTSIGNYAFSGCSGLTSVTLNSNAIASKKYTSSYSLRNVFGQQVNTYVIGEDVTNIGEYAFYRCSGLTSVTIGKSVTSIGNYAFSGCSGLTSVTLNSNAIVTSGSSLRYVFGQQVNTYVIGEDVTSIGEYAFDGCSSLTSITIGNSVTSIGYQAFSDCSALTKLISRAAIPPVCDTQALDDINKWECTLLVPDGSLTLYQTADQWKEFFFTEIDPDGIKGVEAEPSPTSEAEYFDLQGRRIDKAQKGINIIRNADGTTKKVLIKR